jgi:hypothetical protein
MLGISPRDGDRKNYVALVGIGRLLFRQAGAQMTFDPKFPTLRETAGTLVLGLTLYGLALLSTDHLGGSGPLVIALVLLFPLLREGRKTKTPQERAEKYPLT